MYLSRTRSRRLRRIFHLWNDFLMFDFGMFSLKLTRGTGGRQMMMMRSDEYEEKSSDNFPIGKFIAKRNFRISSLHDFREKKFTSLVYALHFCLMSQDFSSELELEKQKFSWKVMRLLRKTATENGENGKIIICLNSCCSIESSRPKSSSHTHRSSHVGQ